MADNEDRAQERGALLASLLMLCAALRETRDENAQLQEQLAARDRTNASLVDYANRGWARVATLSARTQRLLRLAKYWKARCPKRPMSDHLKAIMMARYAVLGGFERGKGEGAAITSRERVRRVPQDGPAPSSRIRAPEAPRDRAAQDCRSLPSPLPRLK
jgi:hypothetical protein